MIQQAKHILRSVFGYDEFISLQQNVMENVLRGKDTLAVMPTGGGKSLCYQIPALIFDGITIVVSPLIALMKDQVDQLSELGVPGVILNSSLSPQEYKSNVERIRQGAMKLLYAAPETLLKPNMAAFLESLPVSCLAIDEAHCISEWGPDFRPEYRELAHIRARMPKAVCIALTATATPRVRADIRSSLGFSESSEFVASFDRENLFLRVVPKEAPVRQVVEFLRRFSNESGIIYCLTRKHVDALASTLQSQGFSVCSYHAGLSEEERNRSQERFVRDEVQIIVATIAFGMGINKSNVRFVIHYDIPKNIESYYQEIGRAGRDGLRSECLLLFSYGDLHKVRAFIDKKRDEEKRAANLQLHAMVQFAESDVCRRIPLLNYFGESYGREKCGLCDNCLAGERETVDITIPAQKFLSCVKRTGERFGIMHIIQVLRGSRGAKVLKFGHDRLSTYNIGREYTVRQWQQMARQLLHKGLMVQDPEFGSLSLTPRAWEVFRGKEIVLGRLDPANGPSDALKAADNEAGSGGGSELIDANLFEVLRRKRKELADAAQVPPYVIFSDRTLTEMATYRPQTFSSMQRIHGVGEMKLKKYGPVFINLLRAHCGSPPMEEAAFEGEKAPPDRLREVRSERQAAIGAAFNAGKSVGNLADAFQIKPNRVLLHLLHYLQDGNQLNPEYLRAHITVSESLQEEALDAFGKLGSERLKPVFEAMGGRIGYEDLKLLRLCFMNRVHCGQSVSYTTVVDKPYSKQIVCLANSRKFSGYCVAGKELLREGFGGWIRPVGTGETGELTLEETGMKNGRTPKLLDIVTVHLKGIRPHPYQLENHCIACVPWVWNGTLPSSQIASLCDDVDQLWTNGYHSRYGLNDRVPRDLVEKVASSSLLFVRPDRLWIIVGEGLNGLNKIWTQFTYNGSTYCLSVTDPVVEAQYLPMERGEYPVNAHQPFVTVSISEPFEGFCYKLAAGIIL